MNAAGKKLGHFLMKSEIRRGGMGTLYTAIDTMLNRTVALKIIHPKFAKDAPLMSRFKKEAMTQAQMNHPNIITLFSFSQIKGRFLLAMEYADGMNLRDRLEEGNPLNCTESTAYLKQILRGLRYAHSLNIIHGDIKPANILVTRGDQIKLSDFGLARIVGTDLISEDSIHYGTPRYCSPEQIQGRALDSRTDIYSVGITLFEMMTGEVPFDSDSDRKIARAHLKSQPPRPSTLNPQIDKRMEQFILKSIAKQPEQRFQSALEMLEELDNIC